MAPADFPEEIDVFSIPHSRMKELVDRYFDKLHCTDFADGGHLRELLHVLHSTFFEFKMHEYIEDTFIMRKLRSKLKEKCIRNKAVCNCHKDNRLNEMLDLLKDGYNCTYKSKADRINFGIKLRKALEEFTKTFIPHMQEEEEVFQPLLMKYFTYEELIHIKNTVIVEHKRKERDYAGEAQLQGEKEESADTSCESESEDETEADVLEQKQVTPSAETSILHLPPELVLRVMSHLQPRDLCACAQVCSDWSDLAMTPTLWKDLSPVRWAKGDWTFSSSDSDDDVDDEVEDEDWWPNEDVDEDADKDESGDSDHGDSEVSSSLSVRSIQRESRVLLGMTKYLLPRVGSMVKRLNLAHSKTLTNAVMTKMLYYCPNLENLDLSQTRVSDTVFKALNSDCGCKLKRLNLSGCVNITDSTLIRLVKAFDSQTQTQHLRDESNMTVASNVVHHTHDEDGSGISSDHLCKQHNAFNNVSKQCEQKVENDEKLRGPSETFSVTLDTSNPRHGLHSEETQFTSVQFGGLLVGDSEHVNDLEQKLSVSKNCHQRCSRSDCSQNIEDCASVVVRKSGGDDKDSVIEHKTKRTNYCVQTENKRTLQHLNLSGCFQITDLGLRALWEKGGLPNLCYVDLSGCWGLSGDALMQFVKSCPKLSGEHLFYCDNITEGPYPSSAGGCQNLGCDSRYCCRLAQ